MRFALAVLALTLIMVPVLACFSPADNFAFEVLLNKPGISYDLSPLEHARNVSIIGNSIVYRSHCDKNLIVILREVDKPYKGLSIRFQLPVRFTSHPVVDIRVVSNSITLNNSLERLGYVVEKHDGLIKAYLRKGNLRIFVSAKNGSGTITVHVENETLKGVNLTEIKKLLFMLGVNESAWKKAEISAHDVSIPAKPRNFDIKRAVRIELEWLKNNGIVRISDKDINQISSLARFGLAGYNSRLVWENGWKPYYKTSNPVLVKGYCGSKPLPLSKLPKGQVVLERKADIGLIPAIIAFAIAYVLLRRR